MSRIYRHLSCVPTCPFGDFLAYTLCIQVDWTFIKPRLAIAFLNFLAWCANLSQLLYTLNLEFRLDF